MKHKTVAIVQSNYIPWKGYFDLIRMADEFILLDDVQYTRRDWRNRNKIKTPRGLQWLSIAVSAKGKRYQSIWDTKIANMNWAKQHWQALRTNYARAPYFDRYSAELKSLYLDCQETHLSHVNRRFITAICNWLQIDTPIRWSHEYELVEGKSARLLNLCLQAGATHYLSGPAARVYLDEALFKEAGVEIVFMDYGGYPVYEQLHPPFEHGVTALDLLFHTGDEAVSYMKRIE